MRQAIYIVLFLLLCLRARAQWIISGELRTRTEWRDGVGTLKLKGNDDAFFTSQRSRLTIDYQMTHVVFHSAVQDVRVWGQDASTINSADGNKLGLHEAWAEITLADKSDSSFKHPAVDYFAIKIGRQEISYDDQRLLGNLDWLQQARRHDAVVFKLLQKGWQLDLGAAFNQNTDAFNYNGTFYTPANVLPYVKDSKGNLAPTPASYIPLVNAAGLSAKNGSPAVQDPASSNGLYQDYKALQYVYAARTLDKTRISLLALADYFGKYINDSAINIAGKDTGYIYGKHFNQKGVNARITGGLYLSSALDPAGALALVAGFYYQAGRDRDGLQLAAWTSTVSLSYAIQAFTATAGWDYLSGNNSFSASATNHRFDPLYGTPHKFWGNMDYFYVSTGSPTGGLDNPYAKVKYKGKRLSTELDYYYFAIGSNQKGSDGRPINKYLGSELDWVSAYALNKATSVEYGFSVMAATQSMEYAKNIPPGAANLIGLWSYLMVTILLNNHQNTKK
jgi:Alginate export